MKKSIESVTYAGLGSIQIKILSKINDLHDARLDVLVPSPMWRKISIQISDLQEQVDTLEEARRVILNSY